MKEKTELGRKTSLNTYRTLNINIRTIVTDQQDTWYHAFDPNQRRVETDNLLTPEKLAFVVVGDLGFYLLCNKCSNSQCKVRNFQDKCLECGRLTAKLSPEQDELEQWAKQCIHYCKSKRRGTLSTTFSKQVKKITSNVGAITRQVARYAWDFDLPMPKDQIQNSSAKSG